MSLSLLGLCALSLAPAACYLAPAQVSVSRSPPVSRNPPVCASLSKDYLKKSVGVQKAAEEVSELLEQEADASEPEPTPVESWYDQKKQTQASVQKDVAKAGSALGELGVAVGMAAAHSVAAVGVEAGKAAGAAVGKALMTGIFGEKSTKSPPKKEAPTPTVAQASPPTPEAPTAPTTAMGEAIVDKWAWARGMREALMDTPMAPARVEEVDLTLEATIDRLKEIAALELEAAAVQMENQAMEKVTDTIEQITDLPRRAREGAMAEVAMRTRRLEDKIAGKRKAQEYRRSVIDLKKEMTSQRIKSFLPAETPTPTPPPAKPSTPFDFLTRKTKPPPKATPKAAQYLERVQEMAAKVKLPAVIQTKQTKPAAMKPKPKPTKPKTSAKAKAKATPKAKAAPSTKKRGLF